MSFFTEYRQERKRIYESAFYGTRYVTTYKQDRRTKSGLRADGYYTKRYARSYKEIFDEVLETAGVRSRNVDSLAEGLAQFNFIWITLVFFRWRKGEIENAADKLSIKDIILYPLVNFLSIIIYLIRYWSSKSSIVAKILLTIYGLIICTLLLAIIAAVIVGIIVLIKYAVDNLGTTSNFNLKK